MQSWGELFFVSKSLSNYEWNMLNKTNPTKKINYMLKKKTELQLPAVSKEENFDIPGSKVFL